MKIRTQSPASFGSNCHILISKGEAAVVDPSVSVEKILGILEEEGASLRYVLLSHGHFDHIFSLDKLTPFAHEGAWIHQNDAGKPKSSHENGFSYFFHRERTWIVPVKSLQDRDTLPLGDEEITVLHTPGHTSGSVCFLCREHLITGDTLFANNVGRCDLPTGDAAALLHSLERLKELSPDLIIYPGHGPTARLGDALNAVDMFGF